MAIRLGRQGQIGSTSFNLQINDGELDCGTHVYSFIRSITASVTQETTSFEAMCDTGILHDACVMNASATQREEAQVKLFPVQPGITIEELEAKGANGEAGLVCNCPDGLRIKREISTATASYRDIDVLLSMPEILALTTTGGVSLQSLCPNVFSDGNVLTGNDVNQPPDDFGTRTVTYTARKAVNRSSGAGCMSYEQSGKINQNGNAESTVTTIHHGVASVADALSLA